MNTDFNDTNPATDFNDTNQLHLGITLYAKYFLFFVKKLIPEFPLTLTNFSVKTKIFKVLKTLLHC